MLQNDLPVLLSTKATKDGHAIGMIQLNRPLSINALTLVMCEHIHAQLRAWECDPQVVAVTLTGSGEKGFCAGGDVAEVVRQIKAGGDNRFQYGDSFFSVEYALNAAMHHYPKPIIAYAHGITMGGGVGLLAGASHRVVSTRAKIAMPEIHIGLFPDVGGGYFLNKMPCRSGWLMALTGHIINEHDAVLTGLVDFIVPATDWANLLEALFTAAWSDDARENHAHARQALLSYPGTVLPNVEHAPLWQRLPRIRSIMQHTNVIKVRDALLAAADADEWFASPARSLAQGSPTTAHVAWAYLERCVSLGVREVLALDGVLARQFPRHPDFLEGVRAVLIDKDKKPLWSPAQFDAVSPELIEAHFAALD
jgi:enoyl-CoA hydratase/carnithine racemase